MSARRTKIAASVLFSLGLLALGACKSSHDTGAIARPGTSASSAPAALSPARTAIVNYAFTASDAAKIKLSVRDSAGKHEGQFRSFSGTVRVANGSLREAQLIVDVDLGSLQMEEATLDAQLKAGQIVNARGARHARFVSTSIDRGGEQGATDTVKGTLEVLGISRAVEIPSTVHVRSSDVDFDGELTLSRKAFGLSLEGKHETAVADEMTVFLVIAADRVEGSQPAK